MAKHGILPRKSGPRGSRATGTKRSAPGRRRAAVRGPGRRTRVPKPLKRIR